MFGKIKYISDNNAIVEIKKEGQVITNLMNLHVVFESENSTILGEVKNVDENTITIDLLGEFIKDRFIPGTIKKPTLSSNLRTINDQELNIIMGRNENNSLYLGKSPIYENRDIFININDFFSNHLAIFGNSGSGKSFSVSRIIQNIFSNSNFLAYNANMFVFDAYGEYKNAFKNIKDLNPNYQYKFITTNPVDEEDCLLQIPLFLLTNDDISILLNCETHAQLTIIERMMKLVKLFSKNDHQVNELKNHLIASAIQSVLFTNKNASGKKNDIFTIINSCSTPEFNINTEIQGIGYTRRFSDCFAIDRNGEFAESVLINEYLAKNIRNDLESSIEITEQTFYNLKDLEKALNFTLISEGFLNNNIMQDSAIILKVRLHSILNSKNAKYFDLKQLLTKEQYISSLILLNNKRSQLININLEDIDDNLAIVMVKILSKMLFDFAKSRKRRASIPFHLIIEEAHRYVIADNDRFLLGYNIFERIAKEGRKYGTILVLMSQRPSEISETAISQCSNFLMYRMQHPKDLNYVKEMIPNISEDTMNKFKLLQPGTCIAFGVAFKIPILLRMDLPNPPPYSQNANINKYWYE